LNKKKYIESIFLIILGLLTSLSLHPLNFWLVNFFTFSLFFLFLIKKSFQHKSKIYFFNYGWLFGFGYFASNLYWISISLTFDQNFNFLIPLTVILIPAFISIFYGLITYLFIFLKPKSTLSSFFIFSLIFGIIEFIRGSILTGFPWNLIVYSLSNQLEILRITSIIGTYGLNLYCITLFTIPALFFLKHSTKDKFVCLFFITSTIIFYIYGNYYKEKFNIAEKNEFNYTIRVIGSNITLDRFYENENSFSTIKDLIQISSPDKNEKTIFVWPEGILPSFSREENEEFRMLFKENFYKDHLIIIGTNTQSKKNGSNEYFNSLSLYDYEFNLLKNYNKINLVPFGEFLPFEGFLNKIGLRPLTNKYQSFSRGKKRNLIEINEKEFSLKILPLICYEIIYSGKLANDNNFDLILNISEDGWFGKSIGPKQHFAHSIFRAIENGKYILRSSNNGIAAIVNPLGIIENSVDFGESAYIDLKSIKKIQPTIFSKFGNKVFGILILLYIFLIFSFIKNNNEQS